MSPLSASFTQRRRPVKRPPLLTPQQLLQSRATLSTVTKASVGAGPASSAPAKQEVDQFVQASNRLQSLLAGVGSGEDEFVDNMIQEDLPESRLQMQAVLGGVVTVLAVAVATLAGEDPWGGASLTGGSLFAAGVGAIAALPLVMLRSWSWSPQAAKVMPALEDMHMAQVTLQAPWFARSSSWHVFAMLALEVLPITMLLLPAAQGGLMASISTYTTLLGDGMGADPSVPVSLVQLCCLGLTACVSGLGKGLELGVSDQEYEVVQQAVDNSDRYYRLMGSDSSSTSSSSSARAAGASPAAAMAFRSVAQAWMDTRNDASVMSGLISAMDVMCLGGIWYASGNLVAPAVAALAINAVDYFNTHQAVCKREAKVTSRSVVGGRAGGGSSSGPSAPGSMS